MKIVIDNRSKTLSTESALFKATNAMISIKDTVPKEGRYNGVSFDAFNGVMLYVYRTKTQINFRFYDDKANI